VVLGTIEVLIMAYHGSYGTKIKQNHFIARLR